VELSIRQAIEKIDAGQIRIPAFQRGFVWDDGLVAFLMDSIYKGYPFGSIILWRTKMQLRSERTLGPFRLIERDPDYPIDYVLDGQQRLTSIFGIFQTDLEPAYDLDTSWTHVYFDFAAEQDLQESQFVALDPSEFDPDKHFPISTFFDVVKYRAATQELIEERIRIIDNVQATFKEAEIPVQLFETDDRGKVAIVFERVNRLGVELDALQLLSAWTWSEEFDLQERFQDLTGELEPFGFGGIGEDTNLLLRTCAAVVANDVSASMLLNLNGAEVRSRFDEIVNGLRGAIDFLRSAVGVQKLQNLPYPAMLVPLAVFFKSRDGTDVQITDAQREELETWFWRSCLGRRFSGGVLRNLNKDIAEALKLRASGTSSLAEVPCSIKQDWFITNKFTMGSVNTKTFLLLLAQSSPRSFVSGIPVNLGDVLQAYNRSEFHHLNPRKFLAGLDRSLEDINRLANFAIISSADNRVLGGDAPSVYKAKMPEGSINEILAGAICPPTLFDDDYDTFLTERAGLLLFRAQELCRINDSLP
jgi:hypothetical protein